MNPRKVAAVADVTIPPIRGDEEERKYRGVYYESGDYEYFLGDEYYDWELIDRDLVPEPVRMSIEFILAWRALDEPDEMKETVL